MGHHASRRSSTKRVLPRCVLSKCESWPARRDLDRAQAVFPISADFLQNLLSQVSLREGQRGRYSDASSFRQSVTYPPVARRPLKRRGTAQERSHSPARKDTRTKALVRSLKWCGGTEVPSSSPTPPLRLCRRLIGGRRRFAGRGHDPKMPGRDQINSTGRRALRVWYTARSERNLRATTLNFQVCSMAKAVGLAS